MYNIKTRVDEDGNKQKEIRIFAQYRNALEKTIELLEELKDHDKCLGTAHELLSQMRDNAMDERNVFRPGDIVCKEVAQPS